MLTGREGLQRLRELYRKSLDNEKTKILVCAGTGCIASGSIEIYERLVEIIAEKNLPCSVKITEEPGHPAGIKKCGCHGFCDIGPLILVEPEGWLYTKVKIEDCEEIVEKTITGRQLIDRLVYRKNGVSYPKRDEIPFYKKQTRIVLEQCGRINAESIAEYIATGGYSAF
ncbi:MAG: NAD(P)H-dependent oxidoreductase subunit E, partial [Treponema sp.]|nr:NAD(P)H-dependent oxidoreductase subunit E [Treponema sp.]